MHIPLILLLPVLKNGILSLKMDSMAKGELIFLNILYEDEALLVCIKPAGILSQEGPNGVANMPRLLEEYLGPGAYVGIVHRLDREVGGLMVYAKRKDAAAALSGSLPQFGEKEYLAMVHGTMEPSAGEMQDLLFRDASRNKSFVVKRMRKGVREARLCYRTLAYAGERDLSLVRIKLFTGRTHQIRVQFSSRKHPLLGDRKYGGGEGKTIALWSCHFSFIHPNTGKRLSFFQPPPLEEPWTLFEKEIKIL